MFVLKKYPASKGRTYDWSNILNNWSKYWFFVIEFDYLKKEFKIHVVYVSIIYTVWRGYLNFRSFVSLYDGDVVISSIA